MSTVKRRAVTDEQKQEREQVLLDAAWAMYEENDYESVSVASVARAAGLAKGTVYLYFSTKEELFMAAFSQRLCHWFESLRGTLNQTGPCDVDTLAGHLSESLRGRETMLRMFSITHTILERNVDYEAAYRLKALLVEQVTLTAQIVGQCLPGFTMEQIMPAMLYIYALIVGIQQLSDPTPVVRKVIAENPELAVLKIDYTETLAAATANLLRGMAKSQE